VQVVGAAVEVACEEAVANMAALTVMSLGDIEAIGRLPLVP